MKQHATYSPSAAKRWVHCPASVPLTEMARLKGMAYEETSPFANSGTAAMAVLEQMLLHPEDTYAEAFARARATTEPGGDLDDGLDLIQNDDSADAITRAAARFRAIAAESACWEVESQVDIHPGDPHIWGTVDFWALSADHTTLTVADYKHGAGMLIGAEWNYQLMLYSYGLLNGRLANYPITRVRQVICQPRHPEATNDGWDEIEEDPAFIRAFVRGGIIQPVLENKDAPPKIGEHCRYCPAVAVCPSRIAEVKQMEEFLMTNTEALDNMDATELARLIVVGRRVKDYTEKARLVLIRMVEAGVEVPGVALKKQDNRLEWNRSDSEIIEGLSKLLPGKKVAAPLTPAQILREYGSAAPVKQFVEAATKRKRTVFYLYVNGEENNGSFGE